MTILGQGRPDLFRFLFHSNGAFCINIFTLSLRNFCIESFNSQFKACHLNFGLKWH